MACRHPCRRWRLLGWRGPVLGRSRHAHLRLKGLSQVSARRGSLEQRGGQLKKMPWLTVMALRKT